VSSCNIPTIPLTVAQAMSPAPRPPSPTARAATQKAHRQENPNQLTSRDARILMGLPSAEDTDGRRPRVEEFFAPHPFLDEGGARSFVPPVSPNPSSMSPISPKSFVPQRPSREMRTGSQSSEFVSLPAPFV
jgi:hypothetical protein